jgi:hypothetical protein
MARFAVCPREGHLKRMLRIFGYLKYHTKARIKFDLDDPQIGGLEFKEFEWNEQYPCATEEIPYDAPTAKPTTTPIRIICHCDSDHAHDLITRRSVTGYMISINKTPIKFYSKRQNTVESSSYGSELVAGRIATEAIMEFRYKLRMLGIEVNKPSILLIDNQSVVSNTTLPSSTLKKKHNSIAYHRMREAVAAGIIKVGFIRSSTNIADILTKPLGPADYWTHLSEVLYGRERGAEGELQDYVHLGDLATLGQPELRLERSNNNATYTVRTAMKNTTRTLKVDPQFRPVVKVGVRVPRAWPRVNRQVAGTPAVKTRDHRSLPTRRYSVKSFRVKPYWYRMGDVSMRHEGFRGYGNRSSRNVIEPNRNKVSYRLRRKPVEIPAEHVRSPWETYRKVRFPVRYRID